MNALLQAVLADADLLKKKRRIVAQMYEERQQQEHTWRQLSKYINPARGRFDEDTRTSEGKRRDYFLLDPYPMEAHGKCAAGLHSGLTSPSRPWFELGLADEELASYHTVKMWLDDCKEILMDIYAKSNVYNMLLQLEAELSQFGTAGALLLEDFNTAIWCRPYTCGEFAGDVDARGRVARFARKMRMKAWQIIDEFGEDVVSDAVKTAASRDDDRTDFEIQMLIEKNPNYDPEAFGVGNFLWRSYYFETTQQDKFLKISGYNECPFLMPRWTTIANGIYGTGPGHNALGNCMQLQKLESVNMQLLENRANPPLIVPASVTKVSRLPGKITSVPDPTIGNGIKPLFEVTGSRDDVLQAIQFKQSQIGAAFFNDLFVMLANNDTPEMTAREVAERHEEKLLMLSPVLEQMHNEVLSPLTKRSFEICLRNGLFPPVPDELQGREGTIKAEFISLLAQAQKAVATPAIERTLSLAGNLAGISPDVMDNLNLDDAIRKHASLTGTPESVLRDEDEVAKMRQARAEQQAKQQQLENMESMAKPLKDGVDAARLMSEINPDERSIGSIMGGV